jgi:hypothetical protein
MSKSTKSPAAATALSLDGKSAKELRAHLEAGETTAKAVVAHLSAKETLRAPSEKLLAELTGVAPVKVAATPAPVKEVAKAKVVKEVAVVSDLLTATIAALTARIAALEAAAPVKAAKVVAAPPVKAAKVVAAPPVKAAKVVAKAVEASIAGGVVVAKVARAGKPSSIRAEIAAELVDF